MDAFSGQGKKTRPAVAGVRARRAERSRSLVRHATSRTPWAGLCRNRQGSRPATDIDIYEPRQRRRHEKVPAARRTRHEPGIHAPACKCPATSLCRSRDLAMDGQARATKARRASSRPFRSTVRYPPHDAEGGGFRHDLIHPNGDRQDETRQMRRAALRQERADLSTGRTCRCTR